jgi:hypothetical protein
MAAATQFGGVTYTALSPKPAEPEPKRQSLALGRAGKFGCSADPHPPDCSRISGCNGTLSIAPRPFDRNGFLRRKREELGDKRLRGRHDECYSQWAFPHLMAGNCFCLF